MLLVALIACELAPPDLGETPPNVISGEVVASGAPADAVLFLTDAANPMPPLGTGRPFTFTTVRAEDFSEGGLPSAPFAFTNVPDGDWVITGLMDVDADFHPIVSAMAGATCGDVVGAHVSDLTTGALATVPTGGGELVDDVTVLLARPLSTERPAFTVATGVGLVSREAAAAGEVQAFRIEATAVHAGVTEGLAYHLDGPFDPDAPAPCQTGFLTRIADADGNGLPDEHPDFPGTPFLDVGPRIYLTFLGALDDAGLVPTTERWAAQAVVHPQMVVWGELPPIGTAGVVPWLDLVWVPAARQTLADGTERVVTDPTQLPAGAWAITVVEETGQTWTLPNELAYGASLDASFDPALQAGLLVVQ